MFNYDPVTRRVTFSPITAIVPFTRRNGDTYLTILEKIAKFVNELADSVNGNNEQILRVVEAALNDTMTRVEAQLEAQNDSVEEQLETQNIAVSDQLNTQNIAVSDQLNTQNSTIQDLISQTISDVDQAINLVLNNSIELSDEVVATLVQSATDSRAALDGLYENRVKIVHQSFHFEGALIDEFIVSTGGKHFDGVVERPLPGGTPHPTSESQMATVLEFSKPFGDSLTVNGSAWVVEGGAPVARGANIHNGVAYGELSNRHWQDNACVAYCSDGKLRYYEHALGDTSAMAVGDGAVHSWSFGPAIYLDGSPYDYRQSGGWESMAGLVVSARTVLCQYTNGDLGVLQVYGKSNESGLTIDQTRTALEGRGVQTAVVLDGGGSTSAVWKGRIVHPSSDATSRKVFDALVLIGAPASAHKYDQADAAANGEVYSGNVKVSQYEGVATVSGLLTGTANGSAPNSLTIPAANLPMWLRNSRATETVTGQGLNMGVARFRNGGIYISKPTGQTLANPDIHVSVPQVYGLT